MSTLTREAQQRLDRYLADVRSSLRGCRSVDPKDVEADVTEHINGELEGLTEPVSLADLEAVLERLGSPEQWLPAEELPWWRRVLRQLRTGPADYRLAFISFGLLVSAFFFGRLFAPMLILASFCVSRAAVAEASKRDPLGPQRWLFYPSLLVICIPLLILLVSWPVWPLLPLAVDLDTHAPNSTGLDGAAYEVLLRVLPPRNSNVYWPVVGSLIVGLWWMVLGGVTALWPGLPKAVFRPFADWFSRKHAIIPVAAGLLLAVAALYLAAIQF